MRSGDASRRRFIKMLGVAAASPLAARAAQMEKPWRIGTLDNLPRSYPPSFTRELANGLAERGYAEGKDFAFVHRWADWKWERLPQLAAEIVREKPHVIATNMVAAAQALLKETSTVPIVASVGDPIAEGFTKDPIHPDRNITGLAAATESFWLKGIALLRQIAPGISNLGEVEVAEQKKLARPQRAPDAGEMVGGLRRRSFVVATPAEVTEAFRAMRGGHWAAIIPWSLPRTMHPEQIEKWEEGAREIGEIALANGVPTISHYLPFVVRGGILMGWNADHRVDMVDLLLKILLGTPLQEIPFQFPTETHFAINLKTARALGLEVPDEVLLQASRIVR